MKREGVCLGKVRDGHLVKDSLKYSNLKQCPRSVDNESPRRFSSIFSLAATYYQFMNAAPGKVNVSLTKRVQDAVESTTHMCDGGVTWQHKGQTVPGFVLPLIICGPFCKKVFPVMQNFFCCLMSGFIFIFLWTRLYVVLPNIFRSLRAVLYYRKIQ